MKDFTSASFSNIQNSVECRKFNPVIYILSTRCQSRRVIYSFSSQFCVLSGDENIDVMMQWNDIIHCWRWRLNVLC